MAKIATKILGQSKEIELLPAHFISTALDTFLVSSEPHKLIESIIHLSIGIETYIKSSLEAKEPTLINRLDFNRWQNIKGQFTSTHSVKDKRLIIHNELSSLTDLPKTLDYGIALELFPFYYRTPKKVIDDLNEMKGYRNGLFHWKANDESGLSLTKRCIRVFEWVFKFIEKKNGWWIGNEFNIIDPMGKKRELFKQLKQSIRSETLLILQRRVFFHNFEMQKLSQLQAKKNGLVFIPNAVQWPEQSCPACNTNHYEIHWQGISFGKRESNAEYYLSCKNCGFHCSGTEFEIMKPSGFPSLKDVIDNKLKST